jgi:P-type Ca2+ transporter type 2C
VLRRATIANGRFNLLVQATVILTFLATSLNALNRILDTVQLSGLQWAPCLIAVVGYVVLTEVEKLILRRLDHGDDR